MKRESWERDEEGNGGELEFGLEGDNLDRNEPDGLRQETII